LNSLERRVAVAGDRSRYAHELTKLRPVERLDLRPHARLVHLRNMILRERRFVYSVRRPVGTKGPSPEPVFAMTSRASSEVGRGCRGNAWERRVRTAGRGALPRPA